MMRSLVPKLRFGEFSGEWGKNSLDNLTLKISDGIHSTPYYTDSGKYYFINGNNLVNGVISVNKNTKRVTEEEYKKHQRDLNKNTILLSINGTIGNIAVYNNEKVVLGKSACYINIKDDLLNKIFIINFLKTEKVKNYFTTELTGSTIKNLSLKTIKNTLIDLPKLKEQQKIANTLSSLDNLIEAQKKKVEALKKHKKGLMQQLFPREGEKEPRLRFEGFCGEWEEKSLGKITSTITDYVANGSFQSLRENVFVSEVDKFALYIRLLDLRAGLYHSEQKYVDKNSFNFLTKSSLQGGELLMANIGANVGEVWQMPYIEQPATLAPNMIMMKFQPNKDNNFMYYFLDSEYGKKNIAKAISGSGHPKINKTDLKQVKVIYSTLPEQQKIANCLSSLDNLIETQNKKIEALQKHKKGLMQQMFVSA